MRLPISTDHCCLCKPIGHPTYQGASASVALLLQDHLDALIITDAPENNANRRVIVELAEKARLPTIYPYREPVELGGAYGLLPRPT
jgi:hypothetical protein